MVESPIDDEVKQLQSSVILNKDIHDLNSHKMRRTQIDLGNDVIDLKEKRCKSVILQKDRDKKRPRVNDVDDARYEQSQIDDLKFNRLRLKLLETFRNKKRSLAHALVICAESAENVS